MPIDYDHVLLSNVRAAYIRALNNHGVTLTQHWDSEADAHAWSEVVRFLTYKPSPEMNVINPSLKETVRSEWAEFLAWWGRRPIDGMQLAWDAWQHRSRVET